MSVIVSDSVLEALLVESSKERATPGTVYSALIKSYSRKEVQMAFFHLMDEGRIKWLPDDTLRVIER